MEVQQMVLQSSESITFMTEYIFTYMEFLVHYNKKQEEILAEEIVQGDIPYVCITYYICTGTENINTMHNVYGMGRDLKLEAHWSLPDVGRMSIMEL